jgi:glycosyltransferase involved in cell wall biosynthesis
VHIAVIIPAFNVAPWLADCVGSVLAQTHDDWSMVIVDDGSSDETPVIAAGYASPRIHVIRQANAGVSAARNRGVISVMQRPIDYAGNRRDVGPLPDAVLFLDADDWLAPDALCRLTAALDASPWAVAACGGYARVDADGVERWRRPPPEGALLDRLLVRNLFANGGHLLIRREAIEEAGGFRQELTYGEDWEYWTRLAMLGEFVSLPARRPVLFVRDRPGSAYHMMATDPACFQPALNAIFASPAITNRLGSSFVRHLRRRAEAENAWVIGRELIRHGRLRDGRRWLSRSFRDAPNLTRLGLLGLSCLRAGPFRPYRAAV